MNYFTTPGLVTKRHETVKTTLKLPSLQVMEIVSEACGIPIEGIKGTIRKRPYVEARMIYAALVKKYNSISITRIGHSINRNHATIVYYKKHLSALMKYDIDLKSKYDTADKGCVDLYTTVNKIINNELK